MQLIKIYTKDYAPLTTLTEVEFNNLKYKNTHQKIGDCDFTVRLDSDKITNENLEHYNRIEILEDGVVKFVGVIVQKNVNIDTATIRCRELSYVLKKRILPEDYVVNGTTIAVVTALLASINGDDDTGITVGDVSEAIGSINTTFNRANAFDILTQIVNATGNQFILGVDRSLTVKPIIGEDKSEDVIFRYEADLVASSNILQFDVVDDGDDIITKAYGKSGAFDSTQTNAGLETKYGVLEKYRDFRVANTQTVLDDFTEVEIEDKVFAPILKLNPKVEDNFDVGDTVRVILNNTLIDIDTSYQVLEKSVLYKGQQKEITVSINALPVTLATKLIDRDYRLELLEKQV